MHVKAAHYCRSPGGGGGVKARHHGKMDRHRMRALHLSTNDDDDDPGPGEQQQWTRNGKTGMRALVQLEKGNGNDTDDIIISVVREISWHSRGRPTKRTG